MPVSSVQTGVQKRHRTPSYRLHAASGQAIVTLSYRDFYLGEYGTPESRERYDALIAEWLSNGRRAPNGEPTFTVAALINGYVEHCRGYYRLHDGTPNTKELWHVEHALEPLRRLFGTTPAATFGPKRLELVRRDYIDRGFCRSTCNRYTRRIKHVFKWGVARELVPPATWQALAAVEGLRKGRSNAPEPQPVRPVPDGSVDAVQPHVARQVWALIELQRLTGMRPGEAVIIRPVDIDTSGPVWLYRPSHHKTEHHGRERTVAIGPKAQAVLRPFLKRDVSAFCFSPADAERERRAARTAARTTPLSCGNRVGSNRRRRPRKSPGDRYTTASYSKAIAAGCDKAFPVPADVTAQGPDAVAAWRSEHRWSPNQLRHSFATAVRREAGLEAAADALGHSAIDVTLVYAERSLERATAVAAKIG